MKLWLLSALAVIVVLLGCVFLTRPEESDEADGGDSGATGTPTAGMLSASADWAVYSGSTVKTRRGSIRVVITVTNGRITDVTVPVHPSAEDQDRKINNRALPILQRATIAAQNARVDTVSGATITSKGYRTSLQAALDAAHLA